jgi:hypothetical protein
MTTLAEQVYSEILELPIEDKIHLADKLLYELTPVSDTVTQAWILESEQRIQKYRSGSAKSIDGEEVLRSAYRKYQP